MFPRTSQGRSGGHDDWARARLVVTANWLTAPRRFAGSTVGSEGLSPKGARVELARRRNLGVDGPSRARAPPLRLSGVPSAGDTANRARCDSRWSAGRVRLRRRRFLGTARVARRACRQPDRCAAFSRDSQRGGRAAPSPALESARAIRDAPARPERPVDVDWLGRSLLPARQRGGGHECVRPGGRAGPLTSLFGREQRCRRPCVS